MVGFCLFVVLCLFVCLFVFLVIFFLMLLGWYLWLLGMTQVDLEKRNICSEGWQKFKLWLKYFLWVLSVRYFSPAMGKLSSTAPPVLVYALERVTDNKSQCGMALEDQMAPWTCHGCYHSSHTGDAQSTILAIVWLVLEATTQGHSCCAWHSIFTCVQHRRGKS